jgi:hypothetical protein
MGGCWEQISCREATHLPFRAGHHLDAHGQSGLSRTFGCGSFFVGSSGGITDLGQTECGKPALFPPLLHFTAHFSSLCNNISVNFLFPERNFT